MPVALWRFLVDRMSGDSSEVDVIRRLAGRLSTPSAVLNSEEEGQLRKLADVVAHELRVRWDDLLQEAIAREFPILFAYASDGWGTKVAEGHAFACGSHIIRREGRVYTEFLLQRAILKSISPNLSVRIAMNIVEPRGLGAGKTGWNIWQAACDFAGLFRHDAGSNIVMSVYLQDGLHAAGFSRRMMGRHELPFGVELGEGSGLVDPAAREKEWCFGWSCSSHAASNAIKWGLAPYSTSFVTEALHIAIASLKNSSEEILKVVNLFVATRVVFAGRGGTLNDRQLFWTALGVPAHMLDIVLEVNPIWDADTQTLTVSALLESKEDWQDTVASIVCFFLRWQDFSETRWAGVGVSLRLLACSLAIGVEYLVGLVYASKSASTYYLGGFKKLTGEVRLYVGIGVFATWPAETFNLEMMEDDRFLARAPDLWVVVTEEARYVETLPRAVWDAVGSALSLKGGVVEDLRHLALQATSASLAYLDKHVFMKLREHPWSLTQGDIKAKVSALRSADVRDFTTNKLKNCLELLVPETVIVRALVLLKDMPCTTGLCEKAHAAGAFLRRHHCRYGSSMLAARSLMCQVAPLFVLAPERVVEMQLRQKLERLAALRVSYTARNHFCSMLSGESSTGLSQPSERQSARQKVFATHNALFDKLSFGEQHVLRRNADEVRATMVEDSAAAVAAARSELALHMARRDEEFGSDSTVGVRNVVSSVRFTDAELSRIAAAFLDLSRSSSSALSTPIASGGPPLCPDDEVCKLVEALGTAALLPSKPCPWWAKQITAQREHFMSTAIAEASEDLGDLPKVIYCFAFGMQSPALAVFLQAEKVPVCWPAFEHGHNEQ